MTARRPVFRLTFRNPDGSEHIESLPLAEVRRRQREDLQQLALHDSPDGRTARKRLDELDEQDAALIAADAFRGAGAAKARRAKAIVDAAELAKLRALWERARPGCEADADCDRETAGAWVDEITPAAVQQRRERAEKKERWTRP